VKEESELGAIQKNGYTFGVEYSVMLQKCAIHVYRDGEFIEELSFDFNGQEPDPEKIEATVDTYLDNHAEG
jgi:hypothetical protein